MNDQIKYYFSDELKRTHRCGELEGKDDGAGVRLSGWVKKVRELGNLTFLDLWDRSGIVQLVVEIDKPGLHELFRSLRAEDVIAASGTVRRRPENMVNSNMATGEIEVVVNEIVVLNRSKVPPFNVTTDVRANEDLRLRYRYLDLRRNPLQRNMSLRHDLALAARNFLSDEGFIEIETPMLVRRTPEGARDYLVPSRLQPGKFYALPQSPQLYKQILMVSGFDRYFQLARCLRDEDLRADRQPEHTQIDIEMSFVSEECVLDLTERLMKHIVSRIAGVQLEIPFPRMDYADAMSTYGTDKPDLRFGLEIHDCTDIFASSDFRIFRSAVDAGGVVRGISFGAAASYSRKRIQELEGVVKRAGAGGLVVVKVDDGNVSKPIGGSLSGEWERVLLSRFDITSSGCILLVGGEEAVVAGSCGELRNHLGNIDLQEDGGLYNFLWVNRFPLFSASEEGGWDPTHHIFSMPLEDDIDYLETDPGKVRGYLYDLVCNGMELGSGSIRIHHSGLQSKVFDIIGLTREDANHKFGFLLEAFEYGAPPHGGIALGLDRIAMILGGGDSIRDYIAFPKTQRATSLMEGAPSEVEDVLLEELHIAVKKLDNKEDGV